MGVTWASFHKHGKCPTSKRLLNSLDIEKDMGVEMRLINFPGIPHSDSWDFFMVLVNFATSIGDVFNTDNDETFVIRSRIGIGSSGFLTEAFDAKKSLKILLFCSES